MRADIYDDLSEKFQTIYNKYCMRDDMEGLRVSDVILSDENQRKVEDFLTETKYKKKFIEYGLKPVNRILNYGASGTGKTFLTKCMASELGYELLAIDIARALSTGVAATALSDVFELANYIRKCVIFLDECDAIARDRSSEKIPEDPNVRRANNALFQLLDRMSPECIFVAATNLYKELDVAFVRRFDVKMEFRRPPLDELQSAIDKFLLPKFSIDFDMDKEIKDIILYHARDYTGLSYDEIQTWVERAEKKAIIAGREVIQEKDIYSYFMDSLRVKISYDDSGKPYLFKV